MKLRARLSLFTVLNIVVLVGGISVSSIFFLRKLLREESKATQIQFLLSFRQACSEALLWSDPAMVKPYSETLRRSVPGLAYAALAYDENYREGMLIYKDLIVGRESPEFRGIFQSAEAAQDLGFSGDGPFTLVRKTPDGVEIIDNAVAVYDNQGKRAGVARLGFRRSIVENAVGEKIARVQSIVLAVSGAGLLAAVFIALWVAGQLTRPVHLLTAGAKAIGEGDLDTRIDFKRNDELGFLAEEFNTMAVKLKELDQLKDEFVSSVSHELRSPLAAIAGYVELLTRKPIEQIAPEKRAKAFGIIQESVHRLTGFINDILDLAKIKAGRIEVRRTPFHVRQALQDVVGLFQPLFDKKKLEAIVAAGPELPMIPADEEKVKQVITNLVSNAIKFTPEGGRITLAAVESGEEVVITVADSGIGIPKDFQAQIFERFKQVPGARVQLGGPKGTGLGLAIAKGIVQAHGGRIWVESEPEKGSTFQFSLPKRESGGVLGSIFGGASTALEASS